MALVFVIDFVTGMVKVVNGGQKGVNHLIGGWQGIENLGGLANVWIVQWLLKLSEFVEILQSENLQLFSFCSADRRSALTFSDVSSLVRPANVGVGGTTSLSGVKSPYYRFKIRFSILQISVGIECLYSAFKGWLLFLASAINCGLWSALCHNWRKRSSLKWTTMVME